MITMEARTPPLAFKTRLRSRQLRSNMTDAERKLWSLLRRRGVLGARFRRQHPIGAYFADFCCLEHKLVVEIDGGQHADLEEYDQKRTRFFESHGFKVLRFWNHEVLTNLEGVVAEIASKLPPS